MDSFNDIPKEGKRYKLRSRPWDSSFIEIKESNDGDWIYSPKAINAKEPTNQQKKIGELEPCYLCRLDVRHQKCVYR